MQIRSISRAKKRAVESAKERIEMEERRVEKKRGKSRCLFLKKEVR